MVAAVGSTAHQARKAFSRARSSATLGTSRSMTATCPRCGSADIHSSRSRGALETLARVVGLPPRRCAACGWRGLRPRGLYSTRRSSHSELAKVEPLAPPPPSPSLRSGEGDRPLPDPAVPAASVEAGKELGGAPSPPAESEHRRHRHRRHRHSAKKHRAVPLAALLVALALGIFAGVAVYSCGGQ